MIGDEVGVAAPARHHVHVQVFGQRPARRRAQVQSDVEAVRPRHVLDDANRLLGERHQLGALRRRSGPRARTPAGRAPPSGGRGCTGRGSARRRPVRRGRPPGRPRRTACGMSVNGCATAPNRRPASSAPRRCSSSGSGVHSRCRWSGSPTPRVDDRALVAQLASRQVLTLTSSAVGTCVFAVGDPVHDGVDRLVARHAVDLACGRRTGS